MRPSTGEFGGGDIPGDYLDRPVEVLLVGEPEAEVPDSTAIAGPV